MKRYQLHRRKLTAAREREYFEALLSWAAAHADRFVMGINTDVYEDTSLMRTLLSLGRSAAPASRQDSRTVEVHGEPSERFVRELTKNETPAAVVEGADSPVDYLILFAGDRPLYAVYDYGSGQTIDATDGEMAEVKALLAAKGLRSDAFAPIDIRA